MHFNKIPNRQGGFIEYVATVIVIILILVGLRVDVRRYATANNITDYVGDSLDFIDDHFILPSKYIWENKIKPTLTGEKFSGLKSKVEERRTLAPEEKK